MADIPDDGSSRRDDEFPLYDTYNDDQDTPKRIISKRILCNLNQWRVADEYNQLGLTEFPRN